MQCLLFWVRKVSEALWEFNFKFVKQVLIFKLYTKTKSLSFYGELNHLNVSLNPSRNIAEMVVLNLCSCPNNMKTSTWIQTRTAMCSRSPRSTLSSSQSSWEWLWPWWEALLKHISHKKFFCFLQGSHLFLLFLNLFFFVYFSLWFQ